MKKKIPIEFDWEEIYDEYPLSCKKLVDYLFGKSPDKISKQFFLDSIADKGIDLHPYYLLFFFDEQSINVGICPIGANRFDYWSESPYRIIKCEQIFGRENAIKNALLNGLQILEEVLLNIDNITSSG